MGVRLIHKLGDPGDVGALEWAAELVPVAAGRAIAIGCACGHRSELGDTHEVHADGRVTPAWACPKRCGFHDWITLDDWRASWASY